jgi:hypothetical protein
MVSVAFTDMYLNYKRSLHQQWCIFKFLCLLSLPSLLSLFQAVLYLPLLITILVSLTLQLMLASNDEVIRSGVEVAPIVELLVRSHDFISLEGCDSDSPIRKYVKKDAAAVLQYITSNDLVIKIDKSE